MTRRRSAEQVHQLASVGPRRRTALGLSTLIATAFALILTAAPASAARAYDSQIITGSYPNLPWGVTVDPSDNVWVSEPAGYGEGFISEYNPYPSQTLEQTQNGGGYFAPPYLYSSAINATNGDLYVADSGYQTIDVFDPVNFLEQWNVGGSGGNKYVAIDNSGGASNQRVYVAESSGGLVAFQSNHEPAAFSAAGTEPYIPASPGNTITGTPAGAFGEAGNVAVDSEGNIYVVDIRDRVVDEFHSSGEFIREFTGAGAPGGFSSSLSGVAVDPTNGNVLVIDEGNDVVDEFNSSGTYLEQLTGTGPSQGTPFVAPRGIALNSGGYVYVADPGGGVVDIFTPNAIHPKVTYGAVTNQTRTTATLNASIDLNNGPEVTSCVFQYGTTLAYGASVSCSPPTPYTGTTAVSADISGLAAETAYHYRLVLTTANGTRKALDRTFSTLHAVSSLSTGSSSNPEPGSATLSGSFMGDGNDTHYFFEYVDYAHYKPLTPEPYSAGQTTAAPPGADAGSGTGTQDVSAIAHFPSPYIEYHYRIVATNSFGTSYGSDQTLISPPPALPTIDATSASNVTPVSATLNAQVNPGFGPTIVRFEYGPTTSYGSRTYPTESIGADNVDHPASVEISGLTPGTTYYFRALATNFSGITGGPDQTFSTPALPAIADTAATDITQTAATLSATVRPGFRATTYDFEYGLTDSYGSSTPESASVGADNSLHPASASLSGLQPLTTYHYRILAANAIGTTLGPDQAFTTLPPVLSPPPPPVACKHGFVKRHGRCMRVRHHGRKHRRSAHR